MDLTRSMDLAGENQHRMTCDTAQAPWDVPTGQPIAHTDPA